MCVGSASPVEPTPAVGPKSTACTWGEHRHSVNGHVQSNGELHALDEVVPVELRAGLVTMEHVAS
ncbi:hypothetical protein GQ600_2132 [Phytophthora cactorum]|nr:hypothetical protein GQ600_2132 [Phytophthora cactorum]